MICIWCDLVMYRNATCGAIHGSLGCVVLASMSHGCAVSEHSSPNSIATTALLQRPRAPRPPLPRPAPPSPPPSLPPPLTALPPNLEYRPTLLRTLLHSMSEPAPEEGKLGADMAGSSEAALELSEERVDTVSERSSAAEEQDQENDGEEEDDDDDDEPRLKYTRLTKSLGSVYRNGDAVSCNLVFADRMVRPFTFACS